MRCINNNFRISRAVSMVLLACMLSGCAGEQYDMPYDPDYKVSSFQVAATQNAARAVPFASELCIITQDMTDDENVDMSKAVSAVLVDVNNTQVLYAKNAHERLNPASLTKVMTAIVALKYGSMDQVLTATSSVNITESGAQLCGLKEGDRMTLAQAMHILLMYSANDAAMMIAEGVGGSVDNFMNMMNEEARALGATNSNFMNPHGLTEENHYTTSYDLYLIFNEAVKYEAFREIISMPSYNTVYYDKGGKEKSITFETTNQYLRGNYQGPDKVTVIGGKTGTTNAAGHCLLLLTKDTAGSSYISVILRSETRDDLYGEMTDLLDEIGK